MHVVEIVVVNVAWYTCGFDHGDLHGNGTGQNFHGGHRRGDRRGKNGVVVRTEWCGRGGAVT